MSMLFMLLLKQNSQRVRTIQQYRSGRAVRERDKKGTFNWMDRTYSSSSR